jgi:hypothetical protein
LYSPLWRRAAGSEKRIFDEYDVYSVTACGHCAHIPGFQSRILRGKFKDKIVTPSGIDPRYLRKENSRLKQQEAQMIILLHPAVFFIFQSYRSPSVGNYSTFPGSQ